MRTFTISEYREMSLRFNRMSFRDKIKTIKNNSDILTLASDGNWWGVEAKDESIQNELEENDDNFRITNEWGASEMFELISLLEISNTSL